MGHGLRQCRSKVRGRFAFPGARNPRIFRAFRDSTKKKSSVFPGVFPLLSSGTPEQILETATAFSSFLINAVFFYFGILVGGFCAFKKRPDSRKPRCPCLERHPLRKHCETRSEVGCFSAFFKEKADSLYRQFRNCLRKLCFYLGGGLFALHNVCGESEEQRPPPQFTQNQKSSSEQVHEPFLLDFGLMPQGSWFKKFRRTSRSSSRKRGVFWHLRSRSGTVSLKAEIPLSATSRLTKTIPWTENPRIGNGQLSLIFGVPIKCAFSPPLVA